MKLEKIIKKIESIFSYIEAIFIATTIFAAICFIIYCFAFLLPISIYYVAIDLNLSLFVRILLISLLGFAEIVALLGIVHCILLLIDDKKKHKKH